ncbi:signal recognition particle subunit SRP19 [Acrasis kona]|uniref:Signal recognition particle subunit SRP19 n=1 Tax=Acrasis kona TaxID=1008807 RepID=A0AAW2ZB26_9EUKA
MMSSPSAVTDTKGWSTIYPIYIDAGRAYDDGRRIAKDKAVSNPTAAEIYDICYHLRVPCVFMRDKKHPRDQYNPGCVKVKLFELDEDTDSKQPTTKFLRKKDLLIEVCTLVPKLESRIKKAAEAAKEAAKKPAEQPKQQKKSNQQGGKKKNKK